MTPNYKLNLIIIVLTITLCTKNYCHTINRRESNENLTNVVMLIENVHQTYAIVNPNIIKNCKQAYMDLKSTT